MKWRCALWWSFDSEHPRTTGPLAWRVLSGGPTLPMPDPSDASVPAEAPALCALGLGFATLVIRSGDLVELSWQSMGENGMALRGGRHRTRHSRGRAGGAGNIAEITAADRLSRHAYARLRRRKCGAAAPKIVATSAAALTHERERHLQAGCDDFVAKPFRAERIYGCLGQLLGVSFDHAPPAAAEQTIDLRPLTLPEDLAARLAMAAELHSATVLKVCLAEMEILGPAGERVAGHLRTFLASYDMKAIQHLVAQIPVA